MDTSSFTYDLTNSSKHMLLDICPFKLCSVHNPKHTVTLWISPNGTRKNEIDYIMTDRLDIFLDISVINNLNMGSDHRMIRGKARIDIKFERARMVAQVKKVDLGKLQHHRREFQVEIQNKFAALAPIPPDNIDSRGDTTSKMIHDTAFSIADRHKSEKPNKLSTGTKQLR